MRNQLIASAALLGAALALATAPVVVSAQPASPPEHATSSEHPGQHKVKVCRDVSTKTARNTGTVIGAVAGGLLGHSLASGGGKTGGAIIGAGAGAVAGHQIAKHNATHKECHYEWRKD